MYTQIFTMLWSCFASVIHEDFRDDLRYAEVVEVLQKAGAEDEGWPWSPYTSLEERNISHMLHVWNIYLHLGHLYGKC